MGSEGAAGQSRSNLLGSGTIYAAATVAPVIVTLLITPLVTRALGPDGYGVVGISITLYQLGAIVLGLGLSASITRHAIISASGTNGAVALVFSGVALSLIGGLLLGSLLPLWGPLVLGPEMNSAVLLWPILSAASLSALTLSQSVFRAVNRVRTFVILGITSAFAGPLLGFVLVTTVGPNPGVYLCGLALGHLAIAVLALAVLPRIKRSSFSSSELKENLVIGLPTVPHSVASALLVSTLVILASRLEGIQAAGQLQLALFLGTAPIIILGAFNNSWAPAIYRATDSNRPRLLSTTTQAVSVLVLLLVGGFSILVEPVARFIAGQGLYSEQLLNAAQIAAIATPFMALYLANIHLVFLSGKTQLLAITSPVSLLTSLGVVLLLRLAGWDSLVAFAIGIPLFHLSQWLMSMYLRSRTAFAAPRVSRALPALAMAVLLVLGVVLLHPPIVVSAVVLFLVFAAAVMFNRSALRSS